MKPPAVMYKNRFIALKMVVATLQYFLKFTRCNRFTETVNVRSNNNLSLNEAAKFYVRVLKMFDR